MAEPHTGVSVAHDVAVAVAAISQYGAGRLAGRGGPPGTCRLCGTSPQVWPLAGPRGRPAPASP